MRQRHRPDLPKIRFAGSVASLVAILCATAPNFSIAGQKQASAFIPMLRPTVASGALLASAAPIMPASIPGSESVTVVTMKRGDSLFSALRRGGLSAAEAYRDLPKLKGHIAARKLMPGDKLTLQFIGSGKGRQLASVSWSGKHGRSAGVVLVPSALTAAASPPALASVDANMVLKMLAVEGSPSLPRVLAQSNLPPELREQVVMTLSQTRHPPVHGELVTIAYEVPESSQAGAAAELRYIAFTGRDGRRHKIQYRPVAMPPSSQPVEIMPATMVALWDPLPGAPISSPFGWRLHPVFHVRLFHKGVDYEAMVGTPVRAAADGVVEDFGYRGNYGNYIRLRHTGSLETAYGHLLGFSPLLSPGASVRRGDVIGYVGSTGVSTGPHLYYEVLVDGRQIDPEGSALKEASRRLETQTAAAR
ncbi:MAG TPA: M23 family metallopeptidase [Candidatus Udaeobacter sp.]|nr:M23 family metallopeptidase [Candidatus Udaeobacter sp.]